MQLEKVYEPQRFEPHWAQWWIDSGIYRADVEKAKHGRVFSIVIPPPNVTGQLHIGHMFEHTMMENLWISACRTDNPLPVLQGSPRVFVALRGLAKNM